ncbi:MAG: PAS domain-containing protein [Woeseiaceae bacterium]|nr:PAS domain-containing protein [Woeseiaceae bacterium]
MESKVRQLSTAAAEALLKATTDAIIVVDSDGRIVFVNAQAERIFGYSSQELHLQSVETLLPESTRARHRQHRQRFSGAPHSRPLMSGLSLRGLRKNGEIFDAEIALMPIEDGGDRLVASTIRDVSGDNSSELYFQHILEAAPDAIIIVDSDGRIAIANNEAAVMFGYDRDQLIGQRIEMLLPAPLRDRHVQSQDAAISRTRVCGRWAAA